MSSCRPWPAREKFGSTVSCKLTRQLHHLDSINSSVRLNWGLFRHLISYMASLWRRNTTDTPTLHRINNVSVYSLRVSETFQRCLSSAVTENWPPLKFTEENELTFSLLWSKPNDVPKLVLKVSNRWLWQGELNFSSEVDVTSLKGFLTEQTIEHHCTNWESKNLYLSSTRFVWQ